MEKDSAKLRISQIIKSYFRATHIENSDYQGELASSDVNNIVDKIEPDHHKVKLPLGPRWYVKAPESWHKGEDCWANIEDDEINFAGKCWAAAFTRAELKQYHLDSGIFKLVPVEEEK